MIDRKKVGIIIVECDSCDEVLDTETKDFDEARLTMRREGWKVRKTGREYIHGCPKCGVPA